MPVDTLNTCTNEEKKNYDNFSHEISQVIRISNSSRLTITAADEF